MVYLSIEPAGKLAFMKVIFIDIGITLGKKNVIFTLFFGSKLRCFNINSTANLDLTGSSCR
jgi:hypothetical protein